MTYGGVEMNTLEGEISAGEISAGEIYEKNRRLAISIYNFGCGAMSCSYCPLRPRPTGDLLKRLQNSCFTVFKRDHPSIVKVGFKDRSKILAKEWLIKNCSNEELLEILL